MPNAWWYLATVRNLLREHGADGVPKALRYLDEAVVEVARSEVDAERPAASPATSGLLSIDGARWLVVRQRETKPPEVYPFADEADARAFHDRAQEQWSDCYLCAVVLHGVRQVQAPPAASGEAQAIADAVHSVTHYCHAGGGEQALEYDPVAKQWICPVCSDEVMVTPAPPDAALVELKKHLPDNENVRRGYIVAAIRDLAQIALSARGNAEDAERRLTAQGNDAALIAEINHWLVCGFHVTDVGVAETLRKLRDRLARQTPEQEKDRG